MSRPDLNYSQPRFPYVMHFSPQLFLCSFIRADAEVVQHLLLQHLQLRGCVQKLKEKHDD